jgi:hypothetical protein
MYKTLFEDADIINSIPALETVVQYIQDIIVPDEYLTIHNVTLTCTGVEAVGPITSCMNAANYKYVSMYMSMTDNDLVVYVVYEYVPRHHRELH